MEELLNEHSEFSNSGEVKDYVNAADSSHDIIPAEITPHPLRSKGSQRGTSCATLLQSAGAGKEFLNERSEFRNSEAGSCLSQRRIKPLTRICSSLRSHNCALSLKEGGKLAAFTLAEVLITLAIIGIVAAMTIPTIIQTYKAKRSLTALKKNQSLMMQALDMYYAQTGTKVTVETTGHRELKSILMEQLRTVKDCSYGYGNDVDKACIKNYNDTSLNATTYTTYNGNTINLQPFDDGQFVLNDGSLVLLENNTTAALYISIDINGYNKQPNRLGQDLFMFQIDERGVLLPMGAEDTKYDSDTYCSTTSTSNMNGAGCTYKALTDKDFFKNLPK